MGSFRVEATLPADAGRCFDLSLSVDVHTASMADSGERAVAGVTSGVMALGDTVTWRAVHFGVPFRLTSTISAYDRPHRFVDEQVCGPFGRWWHEHRFERVDDTTTRMIDVIEFRSPLGLLGRVVDRLVLDRYMRRLIDQRNRYLLEALSR